MATKLFLSAKWQHLVMINYEIDPSILIPFIPKGTQLDLWNGIAYISLVGFMFLDTRVNVFSVPFHRNFEEVNLRFYVKKTTQEGERRGVVFIKEIVPRWGLAYLARRLFHENYISLPMSHLIEQQSEQITVTYNWRFNKQWQHIQLAAHGEPYYPSKGTEAEFITEHYWGYSKQRNGETFEYEVQHPPWRIWEGDHYKVEVDTENLYGPTFAPYLKKPPISAFLAEGSGVLVHKGISI